MAEENKHPPTVEEQAPPEMPGKPPEMEQAEIPDGSGGPALSAKVIDLSAVRSTPEKDISPDIPKELEAPPVSITEYSKQEWGKPMPEPEKPKPKRGRPAKAEKAAPTEPGAKKEVKAEKSRRGRPPKAEKASPEQAKPPKAGKTHAAPEEKAAPPAPEVPPTPRDATRAEKEEIVYLDLSDLHPFKDHPFGVRDDAEMKSLVESVRNGGVNQPALVRPREGGGYEIIAGHRRCHGGERAGLDEIPCIVREMTDLEAVREMKNSNKQRGDPLPSELAKLLDLELEAIKRQGARPKNDKEAEALGKRSVEIVGKEHDMNYKKVLRYVRLNHLVPELLEKVDAKSMGFMPAVELSYIKPENQRLIAVSIDGEQSSPSVKQAKRLRELDQEGLLNGDVIDGILSEEKREVDNVIISTDELNKYFGKEVTPAKMKEQIMALLDEWKEKQPPELAKPEKKNELDK